MTTAFIARGETYTYVRKVYAWLFVGIFCMVASAWLTVSNGTPIPVPTAEANTILAPPMVALMFSAPFVFCTAFIALALAAKWLSRSVVRVPLFFAFTTFTGFFIGPAICFAQLKAKTGDTISANPVRDASLLTIAAFAFLTAYVFSSGRDFSSWRAFLYTGLWVTLGAALLGLFLGSEVFALAVSSVTVILFIGFVLFDTSKVIHGDHDDAVGDALQLFLDFVNIFLNVLRILAALLRPRIEAWVSTTTAGTSSSSSKTSGFAVMVT